MLNKLGKGLILAVAVSALAASPAAAQRTISFGVSGGLSLPTGDMADLQSSGYHVGGHLNFAPPALPLEIMIDGTYHGFDANDDFLGNVKFSFFGVGANAAYVFPGLMMRPYIMGGLGMYFGKADVPGATSESELGFNAGGGLRFTLSGFSSFLQARINIVDDATFIPVSFGILF